MGRTAEKGPFGGYCNFGIFMVTGKDAQTGKRKFKKLSAVSQEAAEAAAAAAGVVGPYSIELVQHTPPSERQLAYAADLGLSIPDGSVSEDVSALISREEMNGDEDPDRGLVAYAQACGVCFSHFAGARGLLRTMIAQLGARDRAVLFAYAVQIGEAGGKFQDPRTAPQYSGFLKFADMVEADPKLLKLLEARDVYDYEKPNRGTKPYKAAASCL